MIIYSIILFILYIVIVIGCFYTYNKLSIPYILNTYRTPGEMIFMAIFPILNILTLVENIKTIRNEQYK